MSAPAAPATFAGARPRPRRRGAAIVAQVRRPDLWVFIGYQLLLLALVIGYFIHYFGGDAMSRFDTMLRQWDSAWYLSIVRDGYRATGERADAIAFFPLFPVMVRGLAYVLRSDVVTMVVINSVGSVAGHLLFYRALRDRPELRRQAIGATLFLLVWPTAVYFTIGYTEGLYLALTAGFLYALLRDEWEWAVVCGLLAALSRPVGFLCAVPLVVWALTDATRPLRARLWRSSAALVIAAGYVVYLAINRVVYGSWFHFQAVLRLRWEKQVASPITAFSEGWHRMVDRPSHWPWTVLLDHSLTFALPLLFALWVITCRRRFDRARWMLLAWGVAQWIVVASQSWWLSNARYIGLILPVYVMLDDLVRSWWPARVAIAGACVPALLLTINRWVLWKWAF
jgi:hypothetical protein